LEWVSWFNTQRFLELIGFLPPVESEAQYYTRQRGLRRAGIYVKQSPVNPERFRAFLESELLAKTYKYSSRKRIC
jgi:hypothetical protein